MGPNLEAPEPGIRGRGGPSYVGAESCRIGREKSNESWGNEETSYESAAMGLARDSGKANAMVKLDRSTRPRSGQRMIR